MNHEQIAIVAYRLWQERGCPDGSAEIDWEQAEAILRESGQPDIEIKSLSESPKQETVARDAPPFDVQAADKQDSGRDERPRAVSSGGTVRARSRRR